MSFSITLSQYFNFFSQYASNSYLFSLQENRLAKPLLFIYIYIYIYVLKKLNLPRAKDLVITIQYNHVSSFQVRKEKKRNPL